MTDRTLIAAGLVLVLAVGAYPVWSGLGGDGDPGRPVLERARDASGCVEDTLWMRANHQQLLNGWRTAVVRDGEWRYTSASGREFEMSLTGTCLGCHTSSEAFCTRCHEYADVEPTCWSCHVAPEGEGG
jgi:hypothetical protein